MGLMTEFRAASVHNILRKQSSTTVMQQKAIGVADTSVQRVVLAATSCHSVAALTHLMRSLPVRLILLLADNTVYLHRKNECRHCTDLDQLVKLSQVPNRWPVTIISSFTKLAVICRLKLLPAADDRCLLAR